MVKACEEALADRLRSPSTYKRIEFSEGADPLTADQYFAATTYLGRDRSFERTLIESGEYKPRTIYALLTYEASNAYGTPVRNRALCEYVTASERPIITASTVKVDGQTNLEMTIEQLKNAK